jgi:hypothetical protein
LDEKVFSVILYFTNKYYSFSNGERRGEFGKKGINSRYRGKKGLMKKYPVHIVFLLINIIRNSAPSVPIYLRITNNEEISINFKL